MAAAMRPPWQEAVLKALENNKSRKDSKFVQLATVRPDGKPANRTVVFRGFLEPHARLQFTTDARHRKVEEISKIPYGEVCWYFPETREQFRLLGLLELIGDHEQDSGKQEARQQAWKDSSHPARQQFAYPQPGGERAPDDAFDPALPDVEDEPLENFCLLTLEPHLVDYTSYGTKPYPRQVYEREGDYSAFRWTSKDVNP